MNMNEILRNFGNPRFHGNGFTQLYLAKDVRLHIWHPSLKPLRNHNAAIHNHRYDVRSTIYSGKLLHTTYIIDEKASINDHDVRIIQLDGASDAHKSPEIETGRTGKLIVRHEYELSSGSVYTMRNPWFHASDHIGIEPIVTIFERENKSENWAQVICGIDDEQATHAFAPETQPTLKELWKAIDDALLFVGEDCLNRIKSFS